MQDVKKRWPLEFARDWANWLKTYFSSCCDRIEIAGSIRRESETVGDIELVYISKMEPARHSRDFFTKELTPVINKAIEQLEKENILSRRLNKNGSEMYGPKNKLMQLVASEIPVDLFAATVENWFNYLVCRTGPASSNMQIAIQAKKLGYSWQPYGKGFSKGIAIPEIIPMRSEKDVFEFVGIEYKQPKERGSKSE